PYRTTDLADYLNQKSVGFEIRITILGHTQRGGSPTAFDRLLATRMGVKAVELIREGQSGLMTALSGRRMYSVPLEEAIAKLRPFSDHYFDVARFLSRSPWQHKQATAGAFATGCF